MPKSTSPTKSKPTLTLGADLSPAVAAIERVYRMIQKAHPDAPDVTIVVKRDAQAWGHTTVAKVWSPSTSDQADRYEIMVSGENLRRGGRAVLGTLLHEAAHARNLAAGVNDCDSNGRHNAKFKVVAEEHGLSVGQYEGVGAYLGYSKTELTDEGAATWAAGLAIIDKALARAGAAALPVGVPAGLDLGGAARPPKATGPGSRGGSVGPKTRTGNRNLLKATCTCGHSIRLSQRVLESAAPTCTGCGDEFTVATPATKRCPDCGKAGETKGHQECEYPQD